MAACVTDGRGAMTDENIRTIVHTALTSLAAVTAHYRNTDMPCKKAAKMCSRAELVAENSPLSLPDWSGEIFEVAKPRKSACLLFWKPGQTHHQDGLGWSRWTWRPLAHVTASYR